MIVTVMNRVMVSVVNRYYTLHTFVINLMLNAMFGCYGSRDQI